MRQSGALGWSSGKRSGAALCPELDAAGAWLAEHVPDSPAPALLHGDLNLSPLPLAPSSPARVAAVIDWELSTLGDPLSLTEGGLLYFSPARAGRGSPSRSPSPTSRTCRASPAAPSCAIATSG